MATYRTLPSGKVNVQVRASGFPPKSATFDNLEDAEAWATLLQQQQARTKVQALAAQDSSTRLFKESIKDYFESQAHLLKKDSTRKREHQLSVPVLKILGAYSVVNLTSQILQTAYFNVRLKSTYREKPISPDLIRLEKALISAVFNHETFLGHTKFNPVLRTKFYLPKPKNRIIRITVDQENLILDACASYGYKTATDSPPPDFSNFRLLNFTLFLFASGMRPGEASRIKKDWISQDFTQITIPAEFHKNNEPRIVLLTDHLAKIVARQLELSNLYASPYLFFSVREPQRPYPYYHPLKTVFRRAGLPTTVPHGIRHEFITRLFESPEKLSSFEIRDLAGDKNILSLQPYYHATLTRLAPTLEKHHAAQSMQHNKPTRKRGILPD